jgi:hypothetical protein
MRRKFAKALLIIFGLLGFLLIYDAIYRLETNDSFGHVVALVGAALLLLTAIGMFFYNRLELSPPTPKWEKRRRQRLGLHL